MAFRHPQVTFICLNPIATAPMPVDAEAYRKAVSRFATGVAVIATAHRGRMAGMTANALFSLSLNPPSVVLSMQDDAESTKLVIESGQAAVSFLSAEQRNISDLFSKRNSTSEKFAEGTYSFGPGGQPVINGSIAAFEVKVRETFHASDHMLLVCNVTDIIHFDERMPLVYWGGRYSQARDGNSIEMPRPK